MEIVINNEDAELSILENIYSSQKFDNSLTQRDLAEASGLSLGMTIALLKRFSEKGWILLKRLNTRNIQYALTPEGVNEIAHRTYRYFKRTARAANLYKDRERSLEAAALAKQGYLVTYGIKPEYAETGYGCIEVNKNKSLDGKNGFPVMAFREKPEAKASEEFLKAGNFLWNSGMFVFKVGVFLEELKKSSPDILLPTSVAQARDLCCL